MYHLKTVTIEDRDRPVYTNRLEFNRNYEFYLRWMADGTDEYFLRSIFIEPC